MAFDKSKFIDGFKVETREHVQKLNLGFLELEKSPSDTGLLNELMREAHTIKGSATMMGYKRIGELGHAMESGLEKALKGEILLAKEHIDMLFRCLDLIEPLLEDKVTWEDKGVGRPTVENICHEAGEVFSGGDGQVNAEASSPKEDIEEKSVFKEEPVLRSPVKTGGSLDESVRVNIKKLDRLLNLSGEMLIAKIQLKETLKELGEKTEKYRESDAPVYSLVESLKISDESMDALTSNIQSEVMKMRMFSVSVLFNAFPRSMRDLAHEKGKEVCFEMSGEEAELDKAVIDELKDPMMHLLRNSIDHGIELPSERESAGKPPAGRILLSSSHQGSHVVISVSDDGQGIDMDRVKEEAVKKNLISEERVNELEDSQIMQLIFSPGFSTSSEVTETSGRGVGLDVVREKIAKLKGMVEVSSRKGQGVNFQIKVPFTLAVTESLLVGSGTEIFAIPVESVRETIRISPSDIKTVEGKEAITVRGHILPLVRLSDLFSLPRKGIFEKRFSPVVVVQSAEKRIGLLLDRLIGRQEIVGKAIGDPLGKVKNIAGATILGSGKTVLIIDVPSVIESAEGVIIRKPLTAPLTGVTKKKMKTILLAEDVLSTALLEKNILESAGYSVVIARDGQEALEKSRQEKFNMVITDVLMPRMDGFELTARLKKDKDYREVPVVIVTTRESDADKKRGLEAGAQAYILKKDFTSEGLLETIERLIG